MELTTRVNDEAIRRDVIHELRWDPRVQDTPIGVAVHDAVVTLTGTVSGYGTRAAAAEAAHRVLAVRDVANDIVVEVRPGLGRTDTEIAQAVRRMLEWDERVPDDRVTSTVSEGRVTLEGTVETWSEREDAERIITTLAGVQGVVNKIRVTPPPADSDEIRHVIEEVLARRAERHARRIRVEVTDGTVTLSGPVETWADRRALVGAARLTRGVRDVDDRLTVEN